MHRIAAASCYVLFVFALVFSSNGQFFVKAQNDGTLVVNKINAVSDTGSSGTEIVVTVNGQEFDRVPATTGPHIFRFTGSFVVTEEPRPITGPITSGTCNDTLDADEGLTCNLRNVAGSTGDVVSSERGETPNTETGQPGRSAQIDSESAVTVNLQTDPPFQTCFGRVQAEEGGGSNVILAPSSAEYTIEGTTSIKKLNDLLGPDGRVTIKISSDLKANDGITLGYAFPLYTGTIITEKSNNQVEPKEVNEIKFQVNKLTTKCNYINLIKTVDPLTPEGDLTPLGNLGVNNLADTKDNKRPPEPNQNDLLLGGAQLLRSTTEISAVSNLVLNPPFDQCRQGAAADDQDNANIAQYIIQGTIDRQQLRSLEDVDNNQILSIRMTADLVVQNDDKAKIVNNNNPYVSTKWVIDPDTSETAIIDYNTLDVSTQCTGVGFDNMPQVN